MLDYQNLEFTFVAPPPLLIGGYEVTKNFICTVTHPNKRADTVIFDWDLMAVWNPDNFLLGCYRGLDCPKFHKSEKKKLPRDGVRRGVVTWFENGVYRVERFTWEAGQMPWGIPIRLEAGHEESPSL